MKTSTTRLSPAKLKGVRMVTDENEAESVITASPGISSVLLDCINIMDTGSATTLAGKVDAEAWLRAGVATSVKPRETSVRHVRGIGAISQVCMWLKFTLNIGGALVTFHDVPVLTGHNGLLLGNDFLGPGRVDLSYTDELSGTLTIRDASMIPRSLPVQFDVSGADGLSFAADAAAAAAADFGAISTKARAEIAEQQEGAPAVEKALRGVDPIGWVPETTVVPAWSEKDIWIRVPELLVKARDVLLLPLEDERRTDPGVLVAPSLQRVSKEGYAMCRVINLAKTEVRLPLLTPLVRFQIDPRVYNVEYEHTTDEIIDKINVGHDLSTSERDQIKTMLETRRALFRSKLGYAHPYKMKLKIRGIEDGLVKPPNATLRVRSPPEEAALHEEVQKQLKQGILERTRSPFNAMPMLVEKPSKEGQPKQWRVVIDYRAVNQLLERDVYPLPNLELNLSQLGKANWFSSCDLLSGFHQVELADDGLSKEATAFSTTDGQFQYVRMPMGLASSPSTFMRLVDATLSGLPPGICLAYVDDVIIPTCGTFEDHMRDVGMVFDRLIESGFAVRCDKTHIGLKELPYLGFNVGRHGTSPLASKTQAIFDLAVADMWGNPAAAGRYSGMLGFYGRFIPDLQHLLAPFSELKAKSAPVEHILGKKGKGAVPPSLRFLTSFASTRAALANVTALARPDFAKPFYVHIDAATSCGIGGALMQLEDPDDEDSLYPIAFWSRRLQDEERGYDVREQECLGLDQTLKKWRHYLLGAKVHLLTDHASLTWLMTTAHPDGSRVAGWALNAQGYDLEIGWIPGSKNVVADCISRAAKSNAPVLETGAAGDNPQSIVERLEDAARCSTTYVALGANASLESILFRRHATRLIQRCWSRRTHGQRLATATSRDNIFWEWGGSTRRIKTGILELPPARVADTFAATHQQGLATPPNRAKRSQRAALVLLRMGGRTGQLEVAIEKCDGELVLPSVAVSEERLCYRGQLARMLGNMQVPAAVLNAIPYASAFRARKAAELERCQFFVLLVAGDTELSTEELQFRTVSEPSISSLLELSDSTFLRFTVRALGVAHSTGVQVDGRLRFWVGSFKRVQRQLATVKTYAAVQGGRSSGPQSGLWSEDSHREWNTRVGFFVPMWREGVLHTVVCTAAKGEGRSIPSVTARHDTTTEARGALSSWIADNFDNSSSKWLLSLLADAQYAPPTRDRSLPGYFVASDVCYNPNVVHKPGSPTMVAGVVPLPVGAVPPFDDDADRRFCLQYISLASSTLTSPRSPASWRFSHTRHRSARLHRLLREDDEETPTASYVECQHGWVLAAGEADTTIQPVCTRKKCCRAAHEWLHQHLMQTAEDRAAAVYAAHGVTSEDPAQGDRKRSGTIPSLADAPFGPALCVTRSDGAQAIALIEARVRANSGLSIAVDLEGMLGGRRSHIDLIQLAVDSVEAGESQLVFVLDTNSSGIKSLLGQGLLRDLLQDPDVPKVLHCCYGDCSSLYYEYGISVRGAFDTGLADCVLRRVGGHRQRRLDKVMADHVPVATLSMKEGFKHIPGMFAVRPMPLEYFVYAYEDVVHCNQLYIAMREALTVVGLLELTLELSGQRAPPAALPAADKGHRPPGTIAIVLRDATHMVCVQQADGSICLPSGPRGTAGGESDIVLFRQRVVQIWEEVMGLASKALKAAFASRMKKAIRVGEAYVVEVVVKDCTLILSSLRDSAAVSQGWASEALIVMHPCGSKVNPTRAAVEHQRALFQYIWVQSSSEVVAEVKVILGKHVSSQRAAIIVHDDDLVFVLNTAKQGELQFPSAAIELGLTAEESAVRAFDTYAGPSLNKHEGRVGGTSLMPESAKRVRAAIKRMALVGTYGNTMYFHAYVPALGDLRAAFEASRLAINGFRLTATLTKRNPGYAIFANEVARGRLCLQDGEALLALHDHLACARVEQGNGQAATTLVLSQYSGSTGGGHTDSTRRQVGMSLFVGTMRVIRTWAQDSTDTKDLVEGLLTAPRLSQYSGSTDNDRMADQQEYEAAWVEMLEVLHGEELFAEVNAMEDEYSPELGVDLEYDALVEAAVLVRYVALVTSSEQGGSVASALTAHTATTGVSTQAGMPTVQEMRTGQRAHPALQGWIEYLQDGEWSAAWQHGSVTDREYLDKIAQQYFLDEVGVLRFRATANAEGLVVVPPDLRSRVIRQYHDCMHHPGVSKTYKLLAQRFYWGGIDIMRREVADYVRPCGPCQRAKLPTHRAGEHQIGDNGQHPNDVLAGDVYYVGLEEDGYDTTLDFACLFSRAITSIPLQGVPTAETIFSVLASNIISTMGVPSEIRSDQGSNFIAKAMQLIYERMGIKMTIGTAYHHQLVALVERWHRTLGQLIKTHQAATTVSAWNSKWYRCLPMMQLAYNATINASTGYSPFFLQHLRQPRLPSDYRRAELLELPQDIPEWAQARLDDLNVSYDAAARSLRINALSAKRRYDLRHDVMVWFRVGDQVLLIKGSAFDKTAIKPKAELPTDGPFTVLKALPYDKYVLADSKTRRFKQPIHVSRLVPYFGNKPEEPSKWMIGNAPGDRSGGRWPVHSLVGRRLKTLTKRNDELGLPVGAQVLEYKVRWVGFTQGADQWRAVPYLDNIRELVNEYDQHNPFTPADAPDPQRGLDRPAQTVDGPTEQAQAQRHYRAHLNSGTPPPVDSRGSVTPSPKERPREETEVSEPAIESAEDVRRRLHDSLARLPVNTRVRVHFPRDGLSWIGTITKSWLPKWRIATKAPAHHVWVEYDDPQYTEPFEHNVQESVIEVLEQNTLEPVETGDLAPLDLDGKQRARLLRLQRQLSVSG